MQQIAVCGKTSTVENPHGPDHSGFMGFAPKEDPQIAIAVVVEHGSHGSSAAAPIAKAMFDAYFKDVSDNEEPEKVVFRD